MRVKNQRIISGRIASSGQPEAEAFERMAAAGYEAVVNLAPDDAPGAITDERRLVEEAGMIYVQIPVPFDAPDRSHLYAFFETMERLKANKIWIHCAANKRVSAFLYLHARLVQGQSDAEASKTMLASWQPDAVWSEFIKRAISE